MSPSEFKSIRQQLGLSTIAMGRAIGYDGTDESVAVNIRRFEAGMRPIPPTVAVLVNLMAKYPGALQA